MIHARPQRTNNVHHDRRRQAVSTSLHATRRPCQDTTDGRKDGQRHVSLSVRPCRSFVRSSLRWSLTLKTELHVRRRMHTRTGLRHRASPIRLRHNGTIQDWVAHKVTHYQIIKKNCVK